MTRAEKERIEEISKDTKNRRIFCVDSTHFESEGYLSYGDGNSKKSCPSMDYYDGKREDDWN